MADKRVIEQTASTELYNDDWFLKDSVVEGTTKISAAKLKELLGADGTQALEEIANAIAEEYDSTHTYSLNSWVFHEGVLYRCISQSTTGTWNATKWQAKTIKEFIDTAKNSVLSTIEQMLGEYLPISTLDPPSIEAISKGDIFIYQRTNKYKFYRAKADHPQGVTEFDIDDWDEFDTVSDLIEDVAENAGKVADVQVKTTGDYETVVENKIAKIDLSSMTAYGEVPNLPQPIATFKDGADAPMPSLKVAIEPQQDLHGYDAPWVGGSGKNKLNLSTRASATIQGITSEVKANNTIVASGTSTGNGDIVCPVETPFTMANGETYTISLSGTDTRARQFTIFIGTSYRNVGVISAIEHSLTFTVTSELVCNQVMLRTAIGATVNINANVQIEKGSTATSYEPYSNICPISGWDEANISVVGDNLGDCEDIPEPKTSDIWYNVKLLNNTYTISFDVVNAVRTGLGNASVLGIYNNGTTKYILASNIYNVEDGSTYQSKGTNVSGRFYFTYTGEIEFLIAYWRSNSYQLLTSGSLENIMIEVGNNPTKQFKPYNGHTYTIQFTVNGETKTIYSGYVEVKNGKVKAIATHELQPLTNWNWVRESAGGGNYRFRSKNTVRDIYERASSNCTSSAFTINRSPIGGVKVNNTLWVHTDRLVYIYCDSYTDATEFKEFVKDTQLLLPLITPIEYDLSDVSINTLLGTNNVWADTGDINECVYRRDMSSTIDDIIARLEALEG